MYWFQGKDWVYKVNPWRHDLTERSLVRDWKHLGNVSRRRRLFNFFYSNNSENKNSFFLSIVSSTPTLMSFSLTLNHISDAHVSSSCLFLIFMFWVVYVWIIFHMQLLDFFFLYGFMYMNMWFRMFLMINIIHAFLCFLLVSSHL